MFQDVIAVLILESISEKKKENVREMDVYQDISLMPRLSVVKNVQLRDVQLVKLLVEKVKIPNGLVPNVVTCNILLQKLIKKVNNIKLVLVFVHNYLSKELIILNQDKNYLIRNLMNVYSAQLLNHSSKVSQSKEEDVLRHVN